MTKNHIKLREFSRSKRSKSREKENPESSRFNDCDFTSPQNVPVQRNRPRVSELHPSKKRRLVDYSDSDTLSETSSSSSSDSSSNQLENDRNHENNDNQLQFGAVVDPYEGANKPKLSGFDHSMALRYTGRTFRERKEKWIRAEHKLHADYLDATDSWKTNCFVKGKINVPLNLVLIHSI